jgi:hypothetical protein
MLPALHNSENLYGGSHAETYSRDLREKSVRFWTETLMADRIAKLRSGIIRMLKADTNLEVAGEVANFAETLELL